MHFITANEMENSITTLKEWKNEFFETTKSWLKAMHEDLHQSDTIMEFMESLIHYMNTCKDYVIEKNIEQDHENYTSLIRYINTEGKKQKEDIQKFQELFSVLEESLKEVGPQDELGKLIHAMENYHASKCIMEFYGFILAYDKALIALYRYLEKIETKKEKRT